MTSLTKLIVCGTKERRDVRWHATWERHSTAREVRSINARDTSIWLRAESRSCTPVGRESASGRPCPHPQEFEKSYPRPPRSGKRLTRASHTSNPHPSRSSSQPAPAPPVPFPFHACSCNCVSENSGVASPKIWEGKNFGGEKCLSIGA